MSVDISDNRWPQVIELVNSGRHAEAMPLIDGLLRQRPDDPMIRYAAGVCKMSTGDTEGAAENFRRVVELVPEHLEARLQLAFAMGRVGGHKGVAECRDLMLGVFAAHPDFIANHPLGLPALRTAAECCRYVGPQQEAARLGKLLAERTNEADDYFHLSESYANIDQLAEAEAALKMAIKLAPEKYEKSIQRQTLEMIESARKEKSKPATVKRGRYPVHEDFHGDLGHLIRTHLAADHKQAERFIAKDSVFFTMGSCFARNISAALTRGGYNATHMEISEYINTTFANRHFVDWLDGSLTDQALIERIEELLPQGFSKDAILERIRHTSVFILTLGVAPAFFDRQNGNFVMPRPTSLNMRALAEKYLSRTTTVAENVENVRYLLDFIRRVAPKVKFVVTVSPVPLQMSFEFESAVVADCLSKSTMRLVAHEIVNNSGIEDIYYWPSFEVFRWAGSQAGPYFGTDDGAAWHVSEAAVSTTVNSFIETFSAPA